MLTNDETHRLAAALNALRPDWPVKSLVTFIDANLRPRTYRETAVALTWVASDPQTETPKRVLENGPWWNATRAQAGTVSVIPTRCPEHRQHRAASCPECAATPVGDPVTGAATVRGALRAAPKYVPPAVKAAEEAKRRYHTTAQRLHDERREARNG